MAIHCSIHRKCHPVKRAIWCLNVDQTVGATCFGYEVYMGHASEPVQEAIGDKST